MAGDPDAPVTWRGVIDERRVDAGGGVHWWATVRSPGYHTVCTVEVVSAVTTFPTHGPRLPRSAVPGIGLRFTWTVGRLVDEVRLG